MKKNLVIFGVGKIAEVVYYYAKEECGFNIVAFCADEGYITADTFKGLPVVSFTSIIKQYPPADHDMFVAVGYHDMNRLREKKCHEAMNKGYELVSVISPLAHLPSNVVTGWNCFIMPPAIIHPYVSMGNNVFVWSGAIVGHHTTIDDHCWLTSGCSVAGNVHIGANTFLAINATIGHSVRVGTNCFLGANTLLTKNIENNQVLIAESTKPLRLTSDQFLKISGFSSL